jgi:chromosome segregation ATPase
MPWLSIALGVGVLASLGTALYLHAGLLSLRMETQTLAREMSALRQTLAVNDVSHSQNLAEMKTALDATRKETADRVETTRSEARAEARRQAQVAASGVRSTLTKQQDERAKALEMQLSEIQAETREASSKLSDITTQVSSVKTSVESTRGDLDRTIADLKRTTGDMGVMSGLIATNSRELQALRDLGERDYYEFTLSKVNKPQRVGDIQVVVKKTDTKKNKFTLEIVADDKKVEKKDRGLNEPVQFYVVSKARQPYELVVNEVRKSQIVGYLSAPKLKMARRGESD